MPEIEQPIWRIFHAYQSAVHGKDVEAFIELYDPEACVFELWGQWSYQGTAAWRKMAEGWFASLGTERVVVELADVKITSGSDLAIAHAIVTYQGVSAEGQKLRAMQNRLTWALRYRPGGWKIIHEHTSAPVNPDTGKVILQRA
jgi:uncharacterized protein (TIGR02246 family)